MLTEPDIAAAERLRTIYNVRPSADVRKDLAPRARFLDLIGEEGLEVLAEVANVAGYATFDDA